MQICPKAFFPFPKSFFVIIYNIILFLFSPFAIPSAKYLIIRHDNGFPHFFPQNIVIRYTQSLFLFSLFFSFFLHFSCRPWQGRAVLPLRLSRGLKKKSCFFLENCLSRSDRQVFPMRCPAAGRVPGRQERTIKKGRHAAARTGGKEQERRMRPPEPQASRQVSPPCLRLCPWVMKCTCSATLTARRQMRDRLCTTRM